MKIVLLLIVLAIVSAAEAAAYDCGEGRIVSIGDTSGEVILKCGDPDRKQSHTEEIIETLDKDKKKQYSHYGGRVDL